MESVAHIEVSLYPIISYIIFSQKVKAILDKVDALLTDKAINTFSYKKGDSKVISGQDEAVYDWVTVNFLKGAFSGKDKKTYGALDMGGASHQNAFQVRRHNSHRLVPRRSLRGWSWGEGASLSLV